MTGSRLASCFERLRREGRIGLVTFVTAGDPDPVRSREVIRTLDRAGADVIEVGVPFSDPMADGPVIQRASERALAGGTTLRGTLALIASLRGEIAAPLIVFTYANPVLRMGVEPFAAAAADAGVDGVLVLDLPVEEADGLRGALHGRNVDTIFLLSPTSTEARIRRASQSGSGFLYAISRLGVTGARAQVADGLAALVGRIRAHSRLPIAVGFGISRPEHVAEVGRYADAAVVGSALVDIIARAAGGPALLDDVGRYVRRLADATVRG